MHRGVRGLLLLLCVGAPANAQGWLLTDVTSAAGLGASHGYVAARPEQVAEVAGGVAAGDYDGDGWIDLYTVAGDAGTNRLYRNRGDGTFEDRAAEAGVALAGRQGSGPTFADVDGDGWLDLLVLDVGDLGPILYRNRGDGTFEDVTARSGLASSRPGISAAFGDYDLDGDLDLFLTHWSAAASSGSPEYLWQNDGSGRFRDVTTAAGLPWIGRAVRDDAPVLDFSFSPSFSDIDADGHSDLLVTSDFGTSRVFRNVGDGTFDDITTAVIDDENGMGSAVGDVDGDGDLDWFVSSIFDPDGVAEGAWGVTGNRLYLGAGDGTFTDATEALGVRDGAWGWASTFADLDLDGDLDLVHVNGWRAEATTDFRADAARLFVQNADGTFTDEAAERGLQDPDQGRGLVAFDYDRDGDLDLFAANNGEPPRLYRNDGANTAAWLTLVLRGVGPNTEGVGARVVVRTGDRSQLRELRVGSNYVSQNPTRAHFGLGDAASVDAIDIRWPDGAETRLAAVASRQCLIVLEADGNVVSCSAPPCGGGCDDGDPCTTDVCDDTGCRHDAPGGLAGVECVCDRADPAACTEVDVPHGLLRAQARACRLVARAESAQSARRGRRLVRRAAARWRQARRRVDRRRLSRRLGPACATAMRDVLEDARQRASLFVTAAAGAG